jgi:ATP phosphoribosyltransferase regulatory subunit
VLQAARHLLPQRALVNAALDDLHWLASHLQRDHPQVRLGFDLSDMSGYAYYSGTRFAVYGSDSSDALVRGGRYDEVGAVFGRRRPAVGFSLDLKVLAEHAPNPRRSSAVRAPWGEDLKLRAAVRRLRELGETVVCVLPGHDNEGQEFDCDRELVSIDDQWVLRAF